jgi:hypothetical protein
MQRKLTVSQQFELGFRLARLIGYRNITGTAGACAGEPPKKGGRRYVPNYFDPEAAAGRAELLEYVQRADLNTKVLFVQILDRDMTGGSFTSNLTHLPAVEDVLYLLSAPPARVAWALVEAAGLEMTAAQAA